MEGTMDLRFDVKMTTKDLYKYNLRNAYTGMQGILSILFAVLVVFVFIWKFDSLTLVYKLLFIALAIAFLVYIPVSLYIRTKQVMATTDVFKEPLTFIMEDEQIRIESPVEVEDAQSVLPWEDVYRVTKTGSQILIYTNRVSAYIIPRDQIAEVEPKLIEIIKAKIEDFKLRGVK